MTCDKARRLVSMRIDGTISAGDLLNLDEHLVRCTACSVVASDLERITANLRSIEHAQASDAFLDNVRQRVSELPDRSRRTPMLHSWYRPLGAAAVAISAAAVLITVQIHNTSVHEDRAAAMHGAIAQARVQHMALAASSPLEDITVATLNGETDMIAAQDSDP